MLNKYGTTITTPMLLADTYQPDLGAVADNGSVDSVPGFTQSNGSSGSSAFEIQSTTGALTIPRMTTVERILLNPLNGMEVYDTTLNAFQLYENDAWVGLPAVILPTEAYDIPIFTNMAGTMRDSGISLILNGGNTNIFQGVISGNLTLSGTGNIGYGTSVMDGLTTGSRNDAFGTAVLDNLQTGNDNQSFGNDCLHLLQSGSRNQAFGSKVLGTIATTSDNSAFGYNCIQLSANSARNCGFGSGVLASLNHATNCVDNFCGGYNNMTAATSCVRTVSIGSTSAATCVSATECTFIGHGVASVAVTPTFSDLTGVGAWAIHNITSAATAVTSVGWSSMINATTASRCTAVGYFSLSSLTTVDIGSDSSAFGSDSLLTATTALGTTAIGSSAGGIYTQYNLCTFLGYSADAGANNLTNATAIGANATVSASNSLVLGFQANVGIGTSAPTANLHIVSGGTTPALKIAGSGVVVPYRSTGSQVSSANTTDVLYESLSTTPTIALPIATSDMAGQLLFIKNNSFENTGNYLQLIPSGGQQIDGDASVQINGNHAGAIVYTDGNNWFLIACYGNPGNL